MGLLDPFGKDEIARLKNSLTEKANEVIRLQLRISELERLRSELENEKSRTSNQLNTQALQIKVLESSLSGSQSEFNSLRHENRLELARLSGLIEEKENSNLSLSKRIEETTTEIDRLKSEISTLNDTTDKIITSSSDKIEDLEKSLSEQTKVLESLRSENYSQKTEIDGLRAFHDNRSKQFDKIAADLDSRTRNLEQRESALRDKEKHLDQERWKFQQQAEDLRKREAHWTQIIEPQLRQLEAHQTLDAKKKAVEGLEADMQAREDQLKTRARELMQLEITDENLTIRESDVEEWERLQGEQKAEAKARDKALIERGKALESQSVDLNRQAKELEAFRSRVAQLDEEAESLEFGRRQLEDKDIEQQEAHKKRLADIRKKRSELQSLSDELDDKEAEGKKNRREQNRRDADLNAREEAVADRGARLAKIRATLTELRTENKDLKSLLNDCEHEKSTLVLEAAIRERARPKPTPESSLKGEIAPWNPRTDGGDLERLKEFHGNTPLTLMGYRVGHGGIEEAEERHDKLLEIIRCSLAKLLMPPSADAGYKRVWGEGRTGRRIRCVAARLSWDIHFLGAKEENWKAREHWLSDLKWLKATYKDRIPADQWPSIPRG